MIGVTQLAIADLIRHQNYGVVSYQPAATDPKPIDTSIIPVRDKQRVLHFVLLSECDNTVTEQEHQDYWREFKLPLKYGD